MPLFTELISHESFVAEVQHMIYVEQLCLIDENVEIFFVVSRWFVFYNKGKQKKKLKVKFQICRETSN